MKRPIPWARVLAEGTVIVVSILLGLGIDSWWNDREARARARRDLEQVSVELAAARDAIESTLSLHRQFRSGTAALRDMIASAPDGTTVTAPDTLLTGILMQASAEPPTATLTATLSAGSLDAIDNSDLKRALLVWIALLEDLRDDELRARRFQETESGPYLRTVIDVAVAQDVGAAWAQGRLDREQALASHSTPLQSTLRLRNIVSWQVTWFDLLTATSGAALEHLESIQALIQEAV